MQIYHDGSTSYITNGTGILKITGVSGQKIDFMDGSAYYARFNSGSQVDLFHNNSVKFSTKDYGVAVNDNIRLTTGGDGYTFISDSDTGMHNPFNGGLNFKVNGSDRLTINNVGIATFSNVNVEIKQDLDVDGHTNLDNVSIAGVTTFSNSVHVGTGVTIETNGNSNFVGVSSLGTGATGAVYLYNPDADALSGTTNDIYGWKAKTYASGLQVNSAIYLSRSGANGLALSYNNATGSYINAFSGFLRINVLYGGALNLDANDVYVRDRLANEVIARFSKDNSTSVSLYNKNVLKFNLSLIHI